MMASKKKLRSMGSRVMSAKRPSTRAEALQILVEMAAICATPSSTFFTREQFDAELLGFDAGEPKYNPTKEEVDQILSECDWVAVVPGGYEIR